MCVTLASLKGLEPAIFLAWPTVSGTFDTCRNRALLAPSRGRNGMRGQVDGHGGRHKAVPYGISQRDVTEGRAVVARSLCLGLQQPVSVFRGSWR